MALEPTLWRTLPNELLYFVFARLHGAGIGQLRVLSKEWKKNIDCKDSEFNRAFDATTHLNMFGLIPWRSFWRGIRRHTHIYDEQVDKWHLYKEDVELRDAETFGVDGGLLCYISKPGWRKNEPWFCVVMNPLTKHKAQLPPLLHIEAGKSNTLEIVVRMVKLIVNRKTQEYKVFVFGSIGEGLFAQVYDSYTKEWTLMEATHGRIIGWNQIPLDFFSPYCPQLCVYHFANGIQQHFIETNIAPGLKMKPKRFVLLEDHIFVVHKEASPNPLGLLEDGASVLPKTYCISEFHLPEKTTTWVKLRVYNCGPTYGIKCNRLWGCTGFLLVSGKGSPRSWLYNLSTYEWRNLPGFPNPFSSKMMFMMSWSAMP